MGGPPSTGLAGMRSSTCAIPRKARPDRLAPTSSSSRRSRICGRRATGRQRPVGRGLRAGNALGGGGPLVAQPRDRGLLPGRWAPPAQPLEHGGQRMTGVSTVLQVGLDHRGAPLEVLEAAHGRLPASAAVPPRVSGPGGGQAPHLPPGRALLRRRRCSSRGRAVRRLAGPARFGTRPSPAARGRAGRRGGGASSVARGRRTGVGRARRGSDPRADSRGVSRGMRPGRGRSAPPPAVPRSVPSRQASAKRDGARPRCALAGRSGRCLDGAGTRRPGQRPGARHRDRRDGPVGRGADSSTGGRPGS